MELLESLSVLSVPLACTAVFVEEGEEEDVVDNDDEYDDEDAAAPAVSLSCVAAFCLACCK